MRTLILAAICCTLTACQMHVGNTLEDLPLYVWKVKADKHHHTSYISNGFSDRMGIGKNHLRGWLQITEGAAQYHTQNPEQVSKAIGLKEDLKGNENSVIIGHLTEPDGQMYLALFVNYVDSFSHVKITTPYDHTSWYTDLIWMDKTGGLDSMYYGFKAKTAYLIAGPDFSSLDTVSLAAPEVDITLERLRIVEAYHGGKEPAISDYTVRFQTELSGVQHALTNEE